MRLTFLLKLAACFLIRKLSMICDVSITPYKSWISTNVTDNDFPSWSRPDAPAAGRYAMLIPMVAIPAEKQSIPLICKKRASLSSWAFSEIYVFTLDGSYAQYLSPLKSLTSATWFIMTKHHWMCCAFKNHFTIAQTTKNDNVEPLNPNHFLMLFNSVGVVFFKKECKDVLRMLSRTYIWAQKQAKWAVSSLWVTVWVQGSKLNKMR